MSDDPLKIHYQSVLNSLKNPKITRDVYVRLYFELKDVLNSAQINPDYNMLEL